MSLFKIGGVYRNRRGDVAILRLTHATDEFVAASFPVDGPRWENDAGYATHRLSDGWTTYAEEDRPYNLIPGELHNFNGEWLPVGQPMSPYFAEAQAEPVETLGELLTRALDGAFPSVTAADLEMVRKDGPARAPWCVCGNLAATYTVHRTDGPCHAPAAAIATSKPALASLVRVAAMSHQLGSTFRF